MARRRITRSDLKRMVLAESARIQETLELGLDRPEDVAKRTREVDANKYASTLEHCMDQYKLCKLKEAKLIRDLKKIQETKARLKKRLLNNLD